MVVLPPELHRLMQVWEFSVAAGDIPAMMALCTDDIEVIVNGVQPVVGAADVAGMLDVVFAQQRMQRSTRFRNCHLDHDLAVLTADVQVDVSTEPAAAPTRVILREVTILKRIDSVWKVAFNMTNMLNPEHVA